MAEKEAQDRAAKARIITHMNNDHHDSIIRYLQHYHRLSSTTAYTGRLIDIDLTGLTLTCQNKSLRIPLDPPMTSYREARERVVELDKVCRAALGQSDVTVREYVAPTGLYAVPFCAVVATLLAYSRRWWFAAGGPMERVLGSGFAKFSWAIQPWLFWGMVALHGAEMVYFSRTQLPKHSVNVRQRIWLLWSGSVFIEGVFAMRRFREHVERQRAKEKH